MEEAFRDLIMSTKDPVHTYHAAWSWACRRVWLHSHGLVTSAVMVEEFHLADHIVRKHVDHLKYEQTNESAPPARRRRASRRTARDGSGDRRPSPDTAS
jgi:hypothetical protein